MYYSNNSEIIIIVVLLCQNLTTQLRVQTHKVGDTQIHKYERDTQREVWDRKEKGEWRKKEVLSFKPCIIIGYKKGYLLSNLYLIKTG